MIDSLTTIGVFHAYAFKVLKASLVAGALTLWAYQCGCFLVRRVFGVVALDAPSRWALGSALGFGVLAFGTFALGAAGFWRAEAFWGVAALCGAFFLIKERTPWGDKKGPQAKVPWKPMWVMLLVFFFLLVFLGETTPEIFYDALYYHIAIPNLYQVVGRLIDVPTLLFSNFVLTIQWLFGLAMTMASEQAAKLLHGSCALLTVAAFMAMERKYFSPGAGWIASVVYLSTPIVGINVISTGTDVAWSFLQLSAALAFLRALLEPSKKSLALAGTLAGLAASCKYPGLAYLPVAVLILAWKRKSEDKSAWPAVFHDVLWFSVPAFLMVCPLLGRNIVFHGNPLYPFGGTTWGHPPIDPHYWSIFVSDAHARNFHNTFETFESTKRYLLHPWYFTMTGNDNGTWVGPLFLMALPLAFVVSSPKPAYRWLARFAGALWLLWMLTSDTPRYGLPALAIASMIFGEAIILGFPNGAARFCGFGAISLAALANVMGLLSVIFFQDGWRVTGGQIKESTYLAEMHGSYPTPPYSGFAWMNANLPKGSVILVAGEARTHYSVHRVIPSSVPDPQPLVVYARNAADDQAMAAQMRADGITHIFLNFVEAVRTESYGLFPFKEDDWMRFEKFWQKNVELIWKEERFVQGNPKGLYVYRILSPQDAVKPHPAAPNPLERWKPPKASS